MSTRLVISILSLETPESSIGTRNLWGDRTFDLRILGSQAVNDVNGKISKSKIRPPVVQKTPDVINGFGIIVHIFYDRKGYGEENRGRNALYLFENILKNQFRVTQLGPSRLALSF
jgi:hypothetical protein